MGRDGRKKRIGKAKEKQKNGKSKKRAKDDEVNRQGRKKAGKRYPGPMQGRSVMAIFQLDGLSSPLFIPRGSNAAK